MDRRRREKEIHAIVGGPLCRDINRLFDDDIYLAKSWLGTIHTYVRRQQGDTLYADRVGGDKRQRLVAIANRLDLNVETLLEADPDEELRMIHEALTELDGSS